MCTTIVTRAKGMLTDPVGTFRSARNDDFASVCWYILVLYLVNAVCTVCLAAAGFRPAGLGTPAPEGMAPVIALILLIPIGGILGLFLGSVWIHLWVLLAGGKEPLDSTVRATAYSSTPSALFGWIPLIGIIFLLWSLVLLVIGIREYQELSTERALLVVAAAVLVPLILVAVALILFLMPVSSVTTYVPP